MSRVKEIVLDINFFSIPSNISMHNNLFAGILKKPNAIFSRLCNDIRYENDRLLKRASNGQNVIIVDLANLHCVYFPVHVHFFKERFDQIGILFGELRRAT